MSDEITAITAKWEPGEVPSPEREPVSGAEQREAAARAADAPSRQLHEMWETARERMTARAEGRERMLPVPWPSLAALYRAQSNDGASLEVLRPGVHVLVGGTGSGKTQFALSIALDAARHGASVTYVGLELDEVGVVARAMALEHARGRDLVSADERWAERWSCIDWPTGPESAAALKRVSETFSEFVKSPVGDMRLRLGGGRSGFDSEAFGRVLDAAKAGASPERPALVVLDFLQLLAPGQTQEDREVRTRIARASYAANNATQDGRLAVLLVSATARERYDTVDGLDLAKLPAVGSLIGMGKESGEIEYSAASLIVLGKLAQAPAEKVAPEVLGERGWAAVRMVAVAKGRHGADGWCALGWDGSAFYDGLSLAALQNAWGAAIKKQAQGQSGSPSGRGNSGGSSRAKTPKKRGSAADDMDHD